MKVTIAEASMAATNLSNALQSIDRERERISENPAAVAHFETCKQLRRKILRYVSTRCPRCVSVLCLEPDMGWLKCTRLS